MPVGACNISVMEKRDSASDTLRPRLDVTRMVGLRVRELRTTRGWKQDELASQMTQRGFPMGQTTIAKIEHGSRFVTLDELGAFAAVFQTGLAEMFESQADEASALLVQLREARSARNQAREEVLAATARLADALRAQAKQDKTLCQVYEKLGQIEETGSPAGRFVRLALMDTPDTDEVIEESWNDQLEVVGEYLNAYHEREQAATVDKT